MKLFVGVLVIVISCFAYVSSLNCWMCPGGEASFDLCDQNKQMEDCKGMLRCGTFSFIPPKPANASRLYAKSCTTIQLCSGNNSFCKGIGQACRVQCCDTELCNFQKGFAPTSPPLPLTTVVTAAPSTKPTEPTTELTKRPTTKPMTAAPPKPTTKEPTVKPLNPSKDPQSGEDEEDCSWVDGAASSLTSNILNSGICLVSFAIFMSIL